MIRLPHSSLVGGGSRAKTLRVAIGAAAYTERTDSGFPFKMTPSPRVTDQAKYKICGKMLTFHRALG